MGLGLGLGVLSSAHRSMIASSCLRTSCARRIERADAAERVLRGLQLTALRTKRLALDAARRVRDCLPRLSLCGIIELPEQVCGRGILHDALQAVVLILEVAADVEELAAHCTTVGVVQLVVPQRSSATIDVGVGLIVPKLMPYMVMVLLDDAGPFSVGTWLSTGAS